MLRRVAMARGPLLWWACWSSSRQMVSRGQRPLLMSSRLQDPGQKIQFLEGRSLKVAGGAATLEAADGVVYLVISVRNVGTGLAVMHGWHVEVTGQPQQTHPPPEDFTTQTRDIYVASGDIGFWQGAWGSPSCPHAASG